MSPFLRPALLTSLVLLAAAAPAAAQRLLSLPRPEVYGGMSIGSQSIPGRLQSICGGAEAFMTAEMRTGVRSGALALEVRGAAMRELTPAACVEAVAVPDVLIPPANGVFTEREYGHERTEPTVSLDVRLRLGATRAMPLAVSVGAGRLGGPGVPYVLAGVGARTRGAVRFAVDVEGNWYRVEFVEVAREWRDGEEFGVVSRAERSAWWNGGGVRLGVEMDMR